VIASNPDVLLLDEPTNHLDIEALEWLEDYLSGYMGAALIVSHDRAFLDGAVTGILELSGPRPGLVAYPGSYSDYKLAKERELEKQTAAWKDQEAERRRIERDIARTKQTALRTETSTTHDFYRGRAKKVARKAKVRERRLQRILSSPDRVERPRAEWTMKLDFGRTPRGGSRVLLLEDVGHEYDGQWLYRDVNLELEHGERVALLGSNGCGKSTLLKFVAGQATPTLGSVRVGENIKVGYMPQDQAGLDWRMSALDMVRQAADLTETEARTLLHLYLFEGDEPLLPAGSLSYGQRSRLLLAILVLEGANFLVLDEPMNHLDIPSRERFEEALEAFPGTVLMAVHDRAFIDRHATAIWAIESRSVRRYADRSELHSLMGTGCRRG
jgi:ATP-binding cassette subfamily F protein 3